MNHFAEQIILLSSKIFRPAGGNESFWRTIILLSSKIFQKKIAVDHFAEQSFWWVGNSEPKAQNDHFGERSFCRKATVRDFTLKNSLQRPPIEPLWVHVELKNEPPGTI